MAGVNPVVMIQLMLKYRMQGLEKAEGARTFAFQKNNRLRVHKETDEEIKRRKSLLDARKCQITEAALRDKLGKTLHGRIGTVWVDPKLSRVAVPLETATGNLGFGVLPTGSRIPIPKGKFIRAFTYWEKVNDIDLSMFALTEDGRREEFSWRTMWDMQSKEITFSGDQTSGYHGGSEYFDIDVDRVKERHPEYRYMVFCNNVYSGINFDQCLCKAGFMLRETDPKKVDFWKGERQLNDHPVVAPVIFDPKTVATSYRINAESIFAYLFAIDLKTREMVWLNLSENRHATVAGTAEMDFLRKYLEMADIFSIWYLYRMAGEMVDDPEDADICVTDDESQIPTKWPHNGQREIVHSWDFEKFLELLRAG